MEENKSKGDEKKKRKNSIVYPTQKRCPSIKVKEHQGFDARKNRPVHFI